jgi:hypothetical protein
MSLSEYCISWWNLENLFDTEDSPNRSDKLSRVLKNELKGWNEEILKAKINQLSKIISKFNNGGGPDILGICEIENRSVVERLVNNLNNNPSRNYQIVHADTKDQRGIDIAFLYDKNKLEVEKNTETGGELVFSHFIVKRTATRDMLQVNFKTNSSKRLVLIGNHWPSRSGGQYESEPYRIVAGETLSYFHQRILEENQAEVEGEGNTAILVMGDFNDEPFNRSITDYSLSTTSILKVKESVTPRLYNLMWSIMAKGLGTFYFNNFPNLLDQFMISKGIVMQDEFRVRENSTEIISYPEMVKGQYKYPIKFGRPSDNSLNENGFSDHLPISLLLEEIP